MTQETNQATALSAWWNETSFAGKDQYQLKETGWYSNPALKKNVW